MSLGPEARARLRARFLAGLPERLDAMLAVMAGLEAGDPAAQAAAQTLGHQFAGTGASFGYPALSEHGRELEHATGESSAPALARLIEHVRTVLRDADPPLPSTAAPRERTD